MLDHLKELLNNFTSLLQLLPWAVTVVLAYFVIRSGRGDIWEGEAKALKAKIERLEEERTELNKEIVILKTEVARLKAATDLQAVQAKLDAFIAETQRFNAELINTVKQLVTDVNKKSDSPSNAA